jgi:molybdenum cofactor cytidylyltransferase
MLAAGRSERMGDRNKLLLPWDGRTVLEASLDPFCALPFREVVVVTGYENERVEEILAGFPVRLVRNDDYEQGLSASIRAGVAAAVNGIEGEPGGYLFALGDMPMIRSETVRCICQVFLNCPSPSILRPSYHGRGGHPVLFSDSFRTELLELRGDAGAQPILKKHRAALFEVGVDDPGVVVDLDTPESYDLARE